ncbi:MAG: hypothetical protein HQL52_02185 [Magnetococcales bacterium]|nr:hypothetical protein [Magnetococcales bacterium]
MRPLSKTSSRPYTTRFRDATRAILTNTIAVTLMTACVTGLIHLPNAIQFLTRQQLPH